MMRHSLLAALSVVALVQATLPPNADAPVVSSSVRRGPRHGPVLHGVLMQLPQ